MTEYYLEIIHNGVIIYRKESLKPIKMAELSVEVGVCDGANDVAIHTKRHL